MLTSALHMEEIRKQAEAAGFKGFNTNTFPSLLKLNLISQPRKEDRRYEIAKAGKDQLLGLVLRAASLGYRVATT